MGGRMTIPYIPAQRSDTPVTGAWRVHAACRRADPRLFFAAGPSEAAFAQAAQAKRVCAGCPVRAICLDWALTTGREIGVWGGTAPEERRALRAERARALTVATVGGPCDHQPGQLDAGGHVELPEDLPQVVVHRVPGQVQPGGRLTVGHALGDDQRDAALGGGEAVPAGARRPVSRGLVAGRVRPVQAQ